MEPINKNPPEDTTKTNPNSWEPNKLEIKICKNNNTSWEDRTIVAELLKLECPETIKEKQVIKHIC